MSLALSPGNCVDGFGTILNVELADSSDDNYGKVRINGQQNKKAVITEITYGFAMDLSGAAPDPDLAPGFLYSRLFVAADDAPFPMVGGVGLEPDVANWATYGKPILWSTFVTRANDILSPRRPIATGKEGQTLTVFISKAFFADSPDAGRTCIVQMVISGYYEGPEDTIKFVNAR